MRGALLPVPCCLALSLALPRLSPLYAPRASPLRCSANAPAGPADDEAADLRLSVLDHLKQRRLREASLQLESLAKIRGLPDAALYDAAFSAFMAPPVQHRLVHKLSLLHEAYPTGTPMQPEVAEAFVLSAAERLEWATAVRWWDVASLDSRRGDSSLACREAAAHAMARTAQWSRADSLLEPPTARCSSLVVGACAQYLKRQAAGVAYDEVALHPPAELARRAFTLAVSAGVNDVAMLRVCLQASADAGEHAAGLEVLAKSPAALQGDGRVDTIAALLHAGGGDADAAIAALRRARSSSSLSDDVGSPLLGLPPRIMEAVLLACAFAGKWRHARWLLRATRGRDGALTNLSPTAAAAALAACAVAHDDDDKHATPLSVDEHDFSETPFRSKRRIELAIGAARCMDLAEMRSAIGPGEYQAADAPWTRATLWARLSGELAGSSYSDNAEEPSAEDAPAAAEAVLALLSAHAAAGLTPSVAAMLLVLRASAPHPSLRDEACGVYFDLAAACESAGTQPPAEACALVLPLYEAAGRWGDAMGLPHVRPSAYTFSRATEAECEQEAWLRVAESTRSVRWAGRRDAAISRWRETVLSSGGGDLGSGSGVGDARLRDALRRVLQLDLSDEQQADFLEQQVGLVRDGAELPRGVAAKLAYQQVGTEALARARTLLARAKVSGVQLDYDAYGALVMAHAAMGRDGETVDLALEALGLGLGLTPSAYPAALGSVRSPNQLRDLVRGMGTNPRLKWINKYSDGVTGSFLAVAGALGIGGDGRDVPALREATDPEIHTGLTALSMLDVGAGSATSLLQDLRTSGVPVGSATRCMLLASSMQEGWVQQQLALNVWLPLLSPHGEALEEQLRPSLNLVPTPAESGFKGAYCFDWRAPTTHPVLVEWMRLRALSDPRFDGSSPHRGLCPVDLGVHVLEGMLLTRQASAVAQGVGGEPSPAVARTASEWAKQLNQMRLALQALVVRYEAGGGTRGSQAAGSAGGGTRGFSQQRGAVTAPALSSLRGVLREILAALDLQQGIRYGGQLQSARVFIVALEQLQSQLSRTNPALTQGLAVATPPSSSRGRTGKPARGRSKRAAAAGKGTKMTKREQLAADELSREGWVGQGAVDPSPQRSAVAIAACMSLLLESPAER